MNASGISNGGPQRKQTSQQSDRSSFLEAITVAFFSRRCYCNQMWSIHSHLHRISSHAEQAAPRKKNDDSSDDEQDTTTSSCVPTTSGARSSVLKVADEEAFLQSLLAEQNDDEEQDHATSSSLTSTTTTMTYIRHVVLPDQDTLPGLCLRYKVSALTIRRANGGFSGSNLRLAPAILKIPVTAAAAATAQQDVHDPAYKLTCLRHEFPALDPTQAAA